VSDIFTLIDNPHIQRENRFIENSDIGVIDLLIDDFCLNSRG
jgi:hypothetical protein